MGLMPVGVQCPISSSLGEFPSYWDWLWCPGLSPVLVSIALPFAFHTWCFPFALICHWIYIIIMAIILIFLNVLAGVKQCSPTLLTPCVPRRNYSCRRSSN